MSRDFRSLISSTSRLVTDGVLYAESFITVLLKSMLFFSAATRQRAFNLVAQAYDSINVDDLAAFVGMSSSDTVQGKAFKKNTVDSLL